ncbi:cytochrome P450 [Streptomyces sp. NPDC002659]|uniref:cytochrome P450 n=1 Tax=Streptomyces sp. NPDC002659 TaxID=3364656 RepID=UPI0036C5AEA6
METTTSEAPFFNTFDPEFTFESDELQRARESTWYATTPAGLLVLRHAEAWELARDPRLGHDGQKYMELHGITDGPLYDWFTHMLSQVNPTDHDRLRKLVSKAFTPRRVETLRAFARASAQHLAERITPGQPCEFIETFANPLPARVICEALGVPTEDHEWFRHYSDDIGLVFNSKLAALRPRVEAAVVHLTEYVDSLITRRTAQPGDDFISALVAARQDDHLSEDELRNLVLTLIFAGHDQVTCQLGRALATFTDHPDQWELLSQNPALAASATDEVIRWCPSSQALIRYAFEDIEFRGLAIPAGTMIMVSNPAANRDPRAFPHGDRFDITAQHESHQLAFGGGLHRCLGIMLTRLEISEALTALADRFGAPTISGPVRWRPPGAIIYGADSLPLTFPHRP